MELDLAFARCVRCGRGTLRPDGEGIACSDCAARFGVAQGVPLLVNDLERHEAELAEARKVNPAWYVEAQEAEAQSPWRHHLARRRSYVQGVLRRTLAGRALGRAASLLDLGCGDGTNLGWLSGFADRLYGSDYNAVRLARAQARCPEARLFLADILDYPARDGAFEMIFFNHVIEHIPDDARALAEVHRILAPGGTLVLGTPNEGSWWWQIAYRRAPHIRATTDHVHFYTADSIGAKLTAAGFRLQEVRHLGWGPPDFDWDMRLRRHKWLDSLFEGVGRIVLSRQAASLYLIATKPP